MKTTETILTELGACLEAVKWARRKTPERAWEMCKRGDWLLWIAGRLGVDRKLFVLVACACARTSLKFVLKGEDRPRIAIETAEAWTRDEATIEQVQETTAAAHAAHAVHAAHAGYAASSPVYAANAAFAAHAVGQKQMADIVRGIIPFSVIRKAVAEYEEEK